MIKIDTATDILDAYKPDSASTYRHSFLYHLARHNRAEKPQPDPLVAEIDCGRWVVTCECGSGIALHPNWQFAGCFLCGRSWLSIIFPTPEFLAQIDEVLWLRPAGKLTKNPKRFYSWWKDQTVADLIQENVENGWPVPRGVQ